MTEPIQWQPLDELGLWTENPNRGNVGMITGSILGFGYNSVAGIWHGVLKDGNHRTKSLAGIRAEFKRGGGVIEGQTLQQFIDKSAALRVEDGIWIIPTLDISHIKSEREANAFALGVNHSGREGQDDNDMLLAQLMAIQAENPKWVEASGYDGEDIAELELLVGEFQEPTHDGEDKLLGLVNITIDDPKTQVEAGDVWHIGHHVLVCADVINGWAQWIQYLTGNALFLPYPGIYATYIESADETTFVMVQPDTYIAGHIIDRFIDVYGEGQVHRDD